VSVLPLDVKCSFKFFSVFLAFGGISQSFLGRLDGIISIIVIARKNMKVEMKSVLITCRLIILSSRNTIALINFLHCQCNLLGNIENPIAILSGQSVNIFKVFVGDEYNVTSIFAYKERIDESGYKFILVDNISRFHKSIGIFFFLNSQTNRTNVVFWRVTYNHAPIVAHGQNVKQRKVWTSYLSCSKSKLKNTLITEVITVRILWLGRWFLVQTFKEDDDRKIEQDIHEMRALLQENEQEEPTL